MKRLELVIALVVACNALGVTHARAQEPTNPLAPFERLIGGQWHLEGSYQEFEWGVGKHSVKSRSYFVIDGTPRLVGEGFWFWHPGEKQIKGVFTASDMPVVLWDYTTRFEQDKMVNDLKTYDANDAESIYLETWEFTDDSHFVWKLMATTPDGMKEVMGGTYEKKE
jgi:hypothetical protein